MSVNADVVVVGAGLAGLAAGIELQRAGRDVIVLEASDGPGGRVRTDVVDGYRLDRGFQILLTAYPEARRLLDFETLDLRPLRPGAMVRIDDGFARIGDPLRRPADLVATLAAPVGSIVDKLKVLQFRRSVSRGSLDDLWSRTETTGRELLEDAGFSSTMIDVFLQPLFSGVTLDPALSGSSRVIEFVFRMLSQGDAAVPALGMGCISDQLANHLGERLRLQSPAERVSATEVLLASGETLSARAVIVATDLTTASQLTDVNRRGWSSVTSVWFTADEPPVQYPGIVLNGTGRGPINSMVVMSAVSPAYAPTGRHLIVASSPGVGSDVPEALHQQLASWFAGASAWEPIRVDQIDRAQPVQPPGLPRTPTRLANGVILAGDHCADSSINGALASGAQAAATALAVTGTVVP